MVQRHPRLQPLEHGDRLIGGHDLHHTCGLERLKAHAAILQLVLRDDIPAADESWAHQTQPSLTTQAEDPALQDEADEQKRKAVERLQKLRNLSFNMNADLNQEFENVPAYIRRNMELYGNSASVENYYSGYEVTKDDKNQTQISTINTFLEGKKPD